MNKKVNNSLADVIRAWKTGNREYTFESRGFSGLMKPTWMNGEAKMRFHIAIDGFFEDKEYFKPITLDYSSNVFQTSILSDESPDTPEADAVRLKAFLEDFTLGTYQDAAQKLATYATCYTSDPLHMK